MILRGFRTTLAGAFPKPYSAWGFTSRTLIRDRDYGHSALDSIEQQPIGLVRWLGASHLAELFGYTVIDYDFRGACLGNSACCLLAETCYARCTVLRIVPFAHFLDLMLPNEAN